MPELNEKERLRAYHFAQDIASEYIRARKIFHPMHSLHEALGVIEEEFEEFKKEVFAFNLKKGRDTRERARQELIQLAAMALAAVMEVTNSSLIDLNLSHVSPDGKHDYRPEPGRIG